MSVIILTTGVPGCGKTYVRAARFLVDDFLVNGNGIHISNFPLNISAIAEDVSKKINRSRGFFGIFRKKVTPEDISHRLELIPDTVLQSWRAGVSGPWDYFSGRDLKYCHIALDEVHNFINYRCNDDYIKQWDDWLGEVRHRGCTFEGITQDIQQVDQVLTGRASVRLELIPAEDLRDPFFKIRMLDWYELKAGFTGLFHKTVFMLEKRKSDSRWKTNHSTRFLITPEYFKYYNSFSASLQEKASGEVSDDRVPLYEYQKRGKISLLLWFFRRNWFSIFWRLLVALFVLWVCFFGGMKFFINHWVSSSRSIAASNRVSSSPVSTPSAQKNNPAAQKNTPAVQKNISLDEQKYNDEKETFLNDSVRPVLFFDGKCYLSNGLCLELGYVFPDDSSPLVARQKVEDIDAKGRFYRLSSGVVVNMY